MSAIASLVAMGFTEEQATVALQTSAGDVSRAINLLLEQPTAAAPGVALSALRVQPTARRGQEEEISLSLS